MCDTRKKTIVVAANDELMLKSVANRCVHTKASPAFRQIYTTGEDTLETTEPHSPHCEGARTCWGRPRLGRGWVTGSSENCVRR